MWICQSCKKEVSNIDGTTCPHCGAEISEREWGDLVIRQDGLMRVKRGPNKGAPLCRVCVVNGQCGLAFYDKASHREHFMTLEQIRGLLANVCGFI